MRPEYSRPSRVGDIFGNTIIVHIPDLRVSSFVKAVARPTDRPNCPVYFPFRVRTSVSIQNLAITGFSHVGFVPKSRMTELFSGNASRNPFCGLLRRRLLQGHVDLDPQLSKADTHVYRSHPGSLHEAVVGEQGGGTRVSGALALHIRG